MSNDYYYDPGTEKTGKYVGLFYKFVCTFDYALLIQNFCVGMSHNNR